MPKYPHQSSILKSKTYTPNHFLNLKNLQQILLEIAGLSKNVDNLVRHKLAQNVSNSLGYLIFTKKNNGLPKVAQFAKISNLVTL
jgi:hypothetical protein